MDGVIRIHPKRAAYMPAPKPLARPIQNLRTSHRDQTAPNWRADWTATLWRVATFLPALITTIILLKVFLAWLEMGGLHSLEYVLMGLVGITFFWISLAVSTATVGMARILWRKTSVSVPRAPVESMSVALLVPIYNEDTSDVFGNAAAMWSALHSSDTPHEYTLFILSDTQDPQIAQDELQAMNWLRSAMPDGTKLHYRRREKNTERKTGNLADWVECWGGGYEAMIVLDADSLMSAEALNQLSDALASDPTAGLIQSSPKLIGANTLFGRVQQFSSTIYGALLAEGLATWTDREGNYWGHNAIIRTAAFAACAGLPRMPSLRGEGALILSHDFVEAGLLRRAGWAVRFLPGIEGSYEEPPATLVDYALRDRRWCHGNLQHLMILATSGLHTVSRFHLFHGAMSYLLSPLWFALLMIWALLGNGEDSVITYFSESNPLYPMWPEMSATNSILILLFMYGMLLAPKAMGAVAMSLTGVTPAMLGGYKQFAVSFVTEVVASILIAPIMMVQQLVAVVRTLTGIKASWLPQTRAGTHQTLWQLLQFHGLETMSGILLGIGMISGVVSPWLAPIALSLFCAVPISALTRIDLSKWKALRHQLGTPEVFDEPKIFAMAKMHRDRKSVV